jgi:hypothetical protein
MTLPEKRGVKSDAQSLFSEDLEALGGSLDEEVRRSRFLVLGAAGSTGQSVCLELLKRNPRALHAVDLDGDRLAELTDTVSDHPGSGEVDFRSFVLDCGSDIFEAMMKTQQGYDYVLNLAGLDDVPEDADPYTLMRLVEVNILNVVKAAQLAKRAGARKYFCLAADLTRESADTVHASRRIMEVFMVRESLQLRVTMAQITIPVLSDDAALQTSSKCLESRQVSKQLKNSKMTLTPEESGQLCLLACIVGENREILFPRSRDVLRSDRFSDVRVSEAERFRSIGVRCNSDAHDAPALDAFLLGVLQLRLRGHWQRRDFLPLFQSITPEFTGLVPFH